MTQSTAVRPVRSFVRRMGRMTPGQSRALQELWPRFGVEQTCAPLDLDALFGRHAPRVLEIGFGNAQTLLSLAAEHPEQDFLGIEVHDPGLGHALLQIAAQKLSNVRVLRGDAVEALQQRIADGSFDEILIFFPDPWPKKRHHKRRLLQPTFADLLARKLKTNGLLRVATDWQDYADRMLQTLNDCPELRNFASDGLFVARPAMRPATRFERRGQRLGHQVWDLTFCRRMPIPPIPK